MNAKACICATLFAAVLVPGTADAREPTKPRPKSVTSSTEDAQQALRTIGSVAVLPPDVSYVRQVFDGPDEHLPGREQSMYRAIGGQLVHLVKARNLIARAPTRDSSPEERREMRFEVKQLSDALSASIFPDDGEDKSVVPQRTSVGLDIASRVAHRFDADALLLVRYSGWVKSDGMRAKDAAISSLQSFDGWTRYYAVEAGAITLTLIDSASGEVLWMSRGIHVRFPSMAPRPIFRRDRDRRAPDTLQGAVLAAFREFPISRPADAKSNPAAPAHLGEPEKTTVDLDDPPAQAK